MSVPENKTTADLMQCRSCGAQTRECDRFCRRCGVFQGPGTAPLTRTTGEAIRAVSRTQPLAGANRYGSFSGALVNLVTDGISERASSLGAGCWTARMVTILVALPLWMMIVLLSPLDAYLAVRAIAKQV